MTDSVDPITVGLVANRLHSMLQEQQTALVSTAFSPVVRESLDLACAVFDSRGEMVGQSVGGTPGHINAMATGMRHFVDRFPPETVVYSGHGPPTTLGAELARNPFLAELRA